MEVEVDGMQGNLTDRQRSSNNSRVKDRGSHSSISQDSEAIKEREINCVFRPVTIIYIFIFFRDKSYDKKKWG